MHFSKLILAATAFVVTNAVSFTDPTFAGITAGVPFNIMWTGAQGPVTLTLKNGAATNLQTVTTIAQGLPGTSFTWTPSTSLPADTYAIQITDSSGVDNYSTQFQLVGGAPLSVSSSLSSASSSVASSVSSALASITGNSTTSSTITTSSGSASKTSSSASASSSSSKSSASAASKTSSTSSSTASSTPAPSGNSAAGIASPLAMVFLAFAAFMTLN